MEFINYIMLVIWKSFEVIFLSICLFLLLAALMQVVSRFIRNKLSSLIGAKGFAYFTSPGIVVHELGHLFFAIIFGHKIADVSLFNPQPDGTLGYVIHTYNKKSLYQRIGNFFIGTGPIWGGVLVVYFLTRLCLPEALLSGNASLEEHIFNFFQNFFSLSFLLSIKGLVYLYLVFVISLNITLSPPDIKGALDGFLVMLISLFVLIFATLWYINIPLFLSGFFYYLILLLFPISLITFFILALSYCILLIIGKLRNISFAK